MIGISKKALEHLIDKGYWSTDTLVKLLGICEEPHPWQLIETAPKDRRILLFFPGYGVCMTESI